MIARAAPCLFLAALLGAAGPVRAAEPIEPPAPISVSPGTPTTVPEKRRPVRPTAPSPGARADDAHADCAALQRRYIESQECFAPYRLANGGLDAEAFRHCTEVQDPSPRCGLPDLQQP